MLRLSWAACVMLVLPVSLEAGPQESAAVEVASLELATEAGAWLLAEAIEVPGGLGWASVPEADGPVNWSLYSGSPGVVLFLLELGRVLDGGPWAETALAGADALIAREQEAPDGGDVGLYTGWAGMAFVLEQAHQRSGEARFREAATRCVERIHAGAAATEGLGEGRPGARWTASNDIISGSAGVGLLLLDFAQASGRDGDRELAVRAGDELLSKGIAEGQGIGWPMAAGYERRMPNFSHGTAGVAYFLARLYEVTGEPRFLEGAEAGARRLLELADRSSGLRVYHHSPGGEELFYLGWCHGPAGLARLFHVLGRATEDSAWTLHERACSTALVQAGLPEARPAGYWNNLGICCGAAGVGAQLRDRPVEGSASLLQRLMQDAAGRASREGGRCSWEHAEHRSRPEWLQTQTGWMQGAAGIGFWLLCADHAEGAVRLPDDPY